MFRNHWELAAYVRHHIADLAKEHRACSRFAQDDERPARRLSQLRHGPGIGLIQLGHALAGYDAVRGLPPPPSRPALWGPGS